MPEERSTMPKNERLTRSPFIVGNIIRDPEKFWGRMAEYQQILDRLWKKESTSIIGPRRIGKTSLAYYVYTISPQQLGTEYELIWLDGQSNHTASLETFFRAIAHNSSLQYTSGSTEHECLMNFEDAVKSHPKTLVLLINEFEVLTEQNHRTVFREPFYLTLRHLAEHGHLVLITSSCDSLKKLCQNEIEISSPFYNIFKEISLKQFTYEEADGFLDHEHEHVHFTEDERNFIRYQIKNYRHPLKLQIACETIFKNRFLLISKEQLIKIIEKEFKMYRKKRSLPKTKQDTRWFELYQKMIKFLTTLPSIYDSNMQQALVDSAGLDPELEKQIRTGMSPTQFAHLLIPTLRDYGSLEDGRYALVAILEATRGYVGPNKQAECDRLIQELQSVLKV